MRNQINSYSKYLQHLTILLILIFLACISFCTKKTDERSQIFQFFQNGDFAKAEQKIEEFFGSNDMDSVQFKEYSVLLEKMIMMHRSC